MELKSLEDIKKYPIVFVDLWETLLFDEIENINILRAKVLSNYFGKGQSYWLDKLLANIKEYKEFEMKGLSKNSLDRILEIIKGETIEENLLKKLVDDLDGVYLNNLDKIIINQKLDFIFDDKREVYLLSNSGLLSGDATLIMLDKKGLKNKFRKVYLSADLLYCKPSLKFYEQPIVEFNLSKEKIIMIGDSYDKDILPCRKLNIDTFWYKK